MKGGLDMLRNVKSLYGSAVKAANGWIGSVDDIVFVDTSWDIAYVVVKVGEGLHRRKMLVSPVLLRVIGGVFGSLECGLNSEQALHLPDLDSDLPVSLLKAKLLKEYFDLSALVAGTATTPGPVVPPPLTAKEQREVAMLVRKGNPHLRRSKEVSHYHLKWGNGCTGIIGDIFMDDITWRIKYFEADTGGWIHRRKILVESADVVAISWGEREVRVESSGRPGSPVGHLHVRPSHSVHAQSIDG
jgi:hypothetical protein